MVYAKQRFVHVHALVLSAKQRAAASLKGVQVADGRAGEVSCCDGDLSLGASPACTGWVGAKGP